MEYTKSAKGYTVPNQQISLLQFKNTDTINIFTDGSYVRHLKFGAYATAVVNMEDIIYVDSGFHPSPTGGDIELLGLRLALNVAYMFAMQKTYPFINVFCDSLYAIEAVRKYIYTWTYVPVTNTYIIKSTKKEAHFIELIFECNKLFQELLAIVPAFNLYYQGGHADNRADSLEKAQEKFTRINGLRYDVDRNLIRYISFYNNYVDKMAKGTLRNCSRALVEDAIVFIPQPIVPTRYN